MSRRQASSIPIETLQALAEFRHRLRRFLHFSETAAERLGLQAQQHQLLLQIAGAPGDVLPTIGYAADRLCLRHNTAVELADRCEQAGLLKRIEGRADRRQVALELTVKGRKVLTALSLDHSQEVTELAPGLIRALLVLQAKSAKELDGRGANEN